MGGSESSDSKEERKVFRVPRKKIPRKKKKKSTGPTAQPSKVPMRRISRVEYDSIIQQRDDLQREIGTLKKKVNKKKRKISELTTRVTSLTAEPPTKRQKKATCVALTGFKGDSYKFSKGLKKQLISKIGQLGGKIWRDDSPFDDVTHIVTAPRARTLTVLEGILRGKYIMSVRWVEESFEKRDFIGDYSEYGFRRLERPLHKKKIYVSSSFERDTKGPTFSHYQKLVEFGDGIFTKNPAEADFILIGNEYVSVNDYTNERKKLITMYPKAFIVTFAELIDIIYPTYLDRVLHI